MRKLIEGSAAKTARSEEKPGRKIRKVSLAKKKRSQKKSPFRC
jgi:hypothetical protein